MVLHKTTQDERKINREQNKWEPMYNYKIDTHITQHTPRQVIALVWDV